jgi:hypothetical protein
MGAHTPCNCTVNDGHIVSCPLHEAAPQLLEVAEAFCVDYCPNPAELAKWRDKFRAAIRAAKGESNETK